MGVEIGGSAPVLLHRHVPVLLRPGGRIQFGADPRTCVVFPLPEGISPGPVFSAFLSATRGSCLEAELSGTELSPAIATALVAELRRAGLVDKQREPGPVTVVGRDGLRHRLVDALRLRGRTPASRIPDRDARRWLERTPAADIGTVVLTGFEVPDGAPAVDAAGTAIPHCRRCFATAPAWSPWTPDAWPVPACAERPRDEDPAARVLALAAAGRVAAHRRNLAATWRRSRPSAAPGPARRQVLVDPHVLRSRCVPLLPHPRCPVCAAGGRSSRR